MTRSDSTKYVQLSNSLKQATPCMVNKGRFWFIKYCKIDNICVKLALTCSRLTSFYVINYRGIAVTSAIGKLFNSILNKRLDDFLTKNNIIHECQVGFTKNARTTDHMFILKCIIDEYCQRKEGRVFACFVDFQKAFDTVIHTGLKIKLLEAGVGSLFYNIIKRMYEVSRSCIRIDNRVTDFFALNLGVKQGDNLSPSLFKIFINDLPSCFDNSVDPVYINDSPIHCLMYADDIILLSTSADGLQSKLNILEKYCQNWCLTLNPQKTKIMVFNKAGKHIKHAFKYQEHNLECVQHCKYLGIYFSTSGIFSFAQCELYKKALKAYFKLQKNFLSMNPKVQTSLHVFDHTIKPILLYGCEIWGSFNCKSNKFRRGINITLDHIYSNTVSEKLHTKLCKFLLGVHRKSTNFAVLSELGRFPLHFDIVKSIIKYWQRLEYLEENQIEFPVLVNAYKHSRKLHIDNGSSWYSSLQIILENIPELKTCLNNRNRASKHALHKILKSAYIKLWHDNFKDLRDGKLRTYAKIKSQYGFENYLNIIKKFELRRCLSRFRISSHRLQIEIGRYQGTPAHMRFCSKCNLGEVEDEIHFLFKCIKFKDERKEFLKSATESCANFPSLDLEEKLVWLFSNENETVLRTLSQFISNHCI